MNKSEVEKIVEEKGIVPGDIVLLEYYHEGVNQDTHLGMFREVIDRESSGFHMQSGQELRIPIKCNHGILPNIYGGDLFRSFKLHETTKIYAGPKEIYERLLEREDLKYYAKLFKPESEQSLPNNSSS